MLIKVDVPMKDSIQRLAIVKSSIVASQMKEEVTPNMTSLAERELFGILKIMFVIMTGQYGEVIVVESVKELMDKV